MEEPSYTTKFQLRSTRRRRRLTRRSLFKSLKKYWLHPGEDLEDSRRLDNTESILKHYYQQTFKNKFRLLPTLLVTTRAAGNVHLAEPTRTSIITFIKFDLALHSRHRLPLRQSPLGRRRRQGSFSVDFRLRRILSFSGYTPCGYFALFLYIALHRRPFRYPQVSIFGPPFIALDSVSTWPFLRHALDLRPGFGYGLGFWVDWMEEDVICRGWFRMAECGLSWIWGIGFTTSSTTTTTLDKNFRPFDTFDMRRVFGSGFYLLVPIYPSPMPFGLTSSSLDPSYRKGFGVDVRTALAGS